MSTEEREVQSLKAWSGMFPSPFGMVTCPSGFGAMVHVPLAGSARRRRSSAAAGREEAAKRAMAGCDPPSDAAEAGREDGRPAGREREVSLQL